MHSWRAGRCSAYTWRAGAALCARGGAVGRYSPARPMAVQAAKTRVAELAGDRQQHDVMES